MSDKLTKLYGIVKNLDFQLTEAFRYTYHYQC